MAYEPRTFQSTTTNTPPTGTDPMVDNTASGDVQAIKLINPTAGSVAPWINQAARTQSLPVALSTEDAALLADLLTITAFQARTPALGQATAANSSPVVLASDQTLPLPSGAATAARQDTGNASLATLITQTDGLEAALALLLAEATFTGRLGEVQASPTANTVLDRLKALLTGIVLAAGTNAIGKLAANDGVDIGDVTATNLPATVDTNSGNKSASTLRVVLATDQPTMTNTQPVTSTPALAAAALSTRAAINAASSGDNTLVAGTGGQTIRVHKLFLVTSGAVNIKFRSAATDFHPALPLQSGGSFVLDFDGDPWFVTTPADALVLNLSAAVQVSGVLYYTKS